MFIIGQRADIFARHKEETEKKKKKHKERGGTTTWLLDNDAFSLPFFFALFDVSNSHFHGLEKLTAGEVYLKFLWETSRFHLDSVCFWHAFDAFLKRCYITFKILDSYPAGAPVTLFGLCYFIVLNCAHCLLSFSVPVRLARL